MSRKSCSVFTPIGLITLHIVEFRASLPLAPTMESLRVHWNEGNSLFDKDGREESFITLNGSSNF